MLNSIVNLSEHAILSSVENKQRVAAYMDFMSKAFGKNVRTLRLAQGLTQEELAAAMTSVGVPMRQTTIAKMERGARPTTVPEAVELAGVLNVSIYSLLTLDEESQEHLRLAHIDGEMSRLLAKRVDAIDAITEAQAAYQRVLDEIAENQRRRDELVLQIRKFKDLSSYRDAVLDLRTQAEDDAGVPWEAPYGEHPEEA